MQVPANASNTRPSCWVRRTIFGWPFGAGRRSARHISNHGVISRTKPLNPPQSKLFTDHHARATVNSFTNGNYSCEFSAKSRRNPSSQRECLRPGGNICRWSSNPHMISLKAMHRRQRILPIRSSLSWQTNTALNQDTPPACAKRISPLENTAAM